MGTDESACRECLYLIVNSDRDGAGASRDDVAITAVEPRGQNNFESVEIISGFDPFFPLSPMDFVGDFEIIL